MKEITLTDQGYAVMLLVPSDTPEDAINALQARFSSAQNCAPVDFFTGAPVAQTVAPVASVPPKGAGTGAVPAPLRPQSGAAVAPAPTGGEPRRTDAASRIEECRTSLKALANEKIYLMPFADQHAANLKEIRSLLKDSHDSHPLFGNPAVTAYRLSLHDRIIESCEAYGPQSRRYRSVVDTIAAISNDLARLEGARA